MRSASTAAQRAAATEIVIAIADAIRELGSVPSGHLYAQVMGILNLENYTIVINKLKALGYITESNYVLTWVGKEKA